MTLTIRDRIRAAICRHFGHREVVSRYDVCCSRCHLLLRGPLNMTAADYAALDQGDRDQ